MAAGIWLRTLTGIKIIHFFPIYFIDCARSVRSVRSISNPPTVLTHPLSEMPAATQKAPAETKVLIQTTVDSDTNRAIQYAGQQNERLLAPQVRLILKNWAKDHPAPKGWTPPAKD